MISAVNHSSCFHSIHLRIPRCPISPETRDKIKKIVLGVFTAIISIPIFNFFERKIVDLLKKFGIILTKPQEVIQLWNGINGISSLFIKSVLKVAFLAYAVIIGPILEEIIFRIGLHDFLRRLSDNPNSLINRILRVVGNGLIFGACHLSPTQGWTNVPIFLITSLMGCVFAALREGTGDITASSAAHITNNAIAMAWIMRRA